MYCTVFISFTKCNIKIDHGVEGKGIRGSRDSGNTGAPLSWVMGAKVTVQEAARASWREKPPATRRSTCDSN